MVQPIFVDLTPLANFLKAPLYTGSPLTWGLTLFVPLLLASRLLSPFFRPLFLLAASLFVVGLATSPFYLFLFVGVGGILFGILRFVGTRPCRKLACRGLAGGLVLLYFVLMRLKAPFVGPTVHDFGIAYTLIRWLSVIGDAQAGKTLPTSFTGFLCYSFFAPTFFKGPIERFDNFHKTLTEPEPFRLRDTAWLLLRIASALLKWGIAKHFFEMDWKSFFDTPQNFSYGELWIGFYFLSIWFYLLVSAANDLTISACRLAGFRISENYHFPYFKRNLSLFWRSWHMTLTQFCRDYLYIPLGGNKKNQRRNILVVFMAIALWHVVSPAFVLWGLWHGCGMILLLQWRKLCGASRKLTEWATRYPKATYLLSMIVTFHFVAIGWLPFWGGHPQGVSLFLRLVSGNHWKLFEW